MKKIVIPILIILVIALIAIPCFLYFAPVNVKDVTIEVPEGSYSSEIAGILKDNDIIRSETAYKIYLKSSGEGNDLKPGRYTFDGKLTMAEVTAQLKAGGELGEVKVTIPEGYNQQQIIYVLVEKELVTEEDFLAAAANGDYDYEYLPAKGDNLRLQGFLYPETYLFSGNATAEQIIATMLKEFDDNFSEEWRNQLAADGRSVVDWVTMASIVEKEAVVEEDRPIIAGVFYNRLKEDMLLQSCATVQYSLGEVKAALSNEDVQIDNPYNTYRNYGLPPGPIASPGHDSLEAAMYPSETSYIYFVAKPNGAHIFSATYEEHLQAKSDIEAGLYDNE